MIFNRLPTNYLIKMVKIDKNLVYLFGRFFWLKKKHLFIIGSRKITIDEKNLLKNS